VLGIEPRSSLFYPSSGDSVISSNPEHVLTAPCGLCICLVPGPFGSVPFIPSLTLPTDTFYLTSFPCPHMPSWLWTVDCLLPHSIPLAYCFGCSPVFSCPIFPRKPDLYQFPYFPPDHSIFQVMQFASGKDCHPPHLGIFRSPFTSQTVSPSAEVFRLSLFCSFCPPRLFSKSCCPHRLFAAHQSLYLFSPGPEDYLPPWHAGYVNLPSLPGLPRRLEVDYLSFGMKGVCLKFRKDPP